MNSKSKDIKILIIDDENAIRKNIKAYLEDSDYITFEAENGKEGVELFKKEKPHLVLLDLRMPVMDGFEVLSSLKDEVVETPFIVISGTLHINDAILALKCGAWDFLLKPISDMGVVEHIVQKALEKAYLIKNNRTYQNKLEEEIEYRKSMQDKLVFHEKLASLGGITAGIAHEINNPLNYMNNYANLVAEVLEKWQKKVPIDNEDRHEELDLIKGWVDIIREQGERIRVIVKKMITHARQAGDQKVEETDICSLIEETFGISFHAMRAEHTGFQVEMETDLDKSIKKLNIVPSDFNQVFINIFNNAFNAVVIKSSEMSDESYKPKVSVKIKSSEDLLEIYIRDNGIGINPENIKKIFEPFYTSSEYNSTGLGLSLAHEVVAMYGGELNVESKKGEYSEFIIILPENVKLMSSPYYEN